MSMSEPHLRQKKVDAQEFDEADSIGGIIEGLEEQLEGLQEQIEELGF